MGHESGLIHKRHRRGKKRRDKTRLALRITFSLLLIALAASLSAGIIHVVERPVPPFEAMAENGAVAKALSQEAAQERAQETAQEMAREMAEGTARDTDPGVEVAAAPEEGPSAH